MLDKVVVYHDENGYQIRLVMHHYPERFNPITLIWDGRRSNIEKYTIGMTPDLIEALDLNKKVKE